MFRKIEYSYLSKTKELYTVRHIIIKLNLFKCIYNFFLNNKKLFKKKNLYTRMDNFFLLKKKLFIQKINFYKVSLNEVNYIKKKYTEFFFNNKFIFFNKKNFLIINFLRNNNIYIKSKYSKARPFCKSIVIFSLFINVMLVNELHSIYYNISINYSYLIIIVYTILILYSLYLFIKLLG